MIGVFRTLMCNWEGFVLCCPCLTLCVWAPPVCHWAQIIAVPQVHTFNAVAVTGRCLCVRLLLFDG